MNLQITKIASAGSKPRDQHGMHASSKWRAWKGPYKGTRADRDKRGNGSANSRLTLRRPGALCARFTKRHSGPSGEQ
jgi:hypothetical protein